MSSRSDQQVLSRENNLRKLYLVNFLSGVAVFVRTESNNTLTLQTRGMRANTNELYIPSGFFEISER
jgi:hypothetical protein